MGDTELIDQQLVQVTAVGLGKILAVLQADRHGRQFIRIKREKQCRKTDHLQIIPGKRHHQAGEDEPQEDAAHIPHEDPGPGHVERKIAQTGQGNAYREQRQGVLEGIGGRTIQGIDAQQTEADHPAETGNAVDAIHEIVEVRRPDHENENQRQDQQEQEGRKPERGQGIMGCQTGQQREKGG